jgi:hypothetical protein
MYVPAGSDAIFRDISFAVVGVIANPERIRPDEIPDPLTVTNDDDVVIWLYAVGLIADAKMCATGLLFQVEVAPIDTEQINKSAAKNFMRFSLKFCIDDNYASAVCIVTVKV